MKWTARLRSLLRERRQGGDAEPSARSGDPRGASPDGLSARYDPEHEARVQAVGCAWLEDLRHAESTAGIWSDRLIERALDDPAFKVELFRFVDVFPMLRRPEQIHALLVDYFSQPGVALPRGMNLGLRASRLAKRTASRAIGHQIESMARTFIAGQGPSEALPRLRDRWDAGVAFSIDLLGETCVSDAEAASYAARYAQLIDQLASEVQGWPERPALESDAFGALPRANVSIKVSALDPRLESIDVERSVARASERLRPLLEHAARRGVFVNFDIEHFAIKDVLLRIFERCAESVAFEGGLALQAYLRSAHADVDRVIGWARRNDRQVTVRLVKGAYWDFETIRAQREGWPSPVWATKAQTDACFEALCERLIDAAPDGPGRPGVRLALGSHNVRSIAAALAHVERVGLPPSVIELQMLYGMADSLKQVACARGLRVREYVPVGALIPGMAYLVRRLLENTSNESWLRASSVRDTPDAVLLARPEPGDDGPAVPSAPLYPGVAGVADGRPFHSEPLRDFSDPAQRRAFRLALEGARLEVPPPARDAPERAVERACKAFPDWRATDPVERAACLIRAASELRARRDALSGLIVRENGKCWRDADADVCEAIEFCEYYARVAVELFAERRLGALIGELDHQLLEPRGPAVVIAPWNFPIAIPCGMTTAALVTGNPVILKPAEQTPACARALVEILWRAGVPDDVLQWMPGEGETVGATLVRDPRVRILAFTGSKEVGLDILAAAAQTSPEQDGLKRVVCEMGGKNAIVVDSTADLDEAVLGVRDSAFGFQGQKCSACSRAVVLDDVYEVFLERLIESTRTLVIGDPLSPDTDLGPLIDMAAAVKVRRYIEIGATEGRLELALEAPPDLAERVGKPYVGPHVFSGIERAHRLANEEIFGPVLAVMRVPSFDAALAEANATGYKLTGGVFSRTPSHLERARRELRVGNLYLNRGITGARVHRQPFGGLGLSGAGAQAGGPGYLLQFVDERSVCENTMRRGFSPGL